MVTDYRLLAIRFFSSLSNFLNFLNFRGTSEPTYRLTDQPVYEAPQSVAW